MAFLSLCVLSAVHPARQAAAQPPAEYPRFIVVLWSLSESTPEGQELLKRLAPGRPGSQSRDLSDEILRAAQEGKIKPPQETSPCPVFAFEFHDVNASRVEGQTVWVSEERNGSGQANFVERSFAPKQMSVAVCRGAGYLIAPQRPPWNTERIAATVYSPFYPPAIYYPISGSLKTCGPATEAICGGIVQIPTVLSKRLERRGAWYFHFVVP